MNDSRLTLRAALAADRLEDFVSQEQARGVELCGGSEFERALALFLVQRGLRQGPTTRSRLGRLSASRPSSEDLDYKILVAKLGKPLNRQ